MTFQQKVVEAILNCQCLGRFEIHGKDNLAERIHNTFDIVETGHIQGKEPDDIYKLIDESIKFGNGGYLIDVWKEINNYLDDNHCAWFGNYIIEKLTEANNRIVILDIVEDGPSISFANETNASHGVRHRLNKYIETGNERYINEIGTILKTYPSIQRPVLTSLFSEEFVKSLLNVKIPARWPLLKDAIIRRRDKINTYMAEPDSEQNAGTVDKSIYSHSDRDTAPANKCDTQPEVSEPQVKALRGVFDDFIKDHYPNLDKHDPEEVKKNLDLLFDNFVKLIGKDSPIDKLFPKKEETVIDLDNEVKIKVVSGDDSQRYKEVVNMLSTIAVNRHKKVTGVEDAPSRIYPLNGETPLPGSGKNGTHMFLTPNGMVRIVKVDVDGELINEEIVLRDVYERNYVKKVNDTFTRAFMYENRTYIMVYEDRNNTLRISNHPSISTSSAYFNLSFTKDNVLIDTVVPNWVTAMTVFDAYKHAVITGTVTDRTIAEIYRSFNL